MKTSFENLWKHSTARQKAQMEALVMDRWGQSQAIASEEMCSPSLAFLDNQLKLSATELPLWSRLFFVDPVFSRFAYGWGRMFHRWSETKSWQNMAWPWPSDPYEFEKVILKSPTLRTRDTVHGLNEKMTSVVQMCVTSPKDTPQSQEHLALLDDFIAMAEGAKKSAKTDQVAGLLVQAMLPAYAYRLLTPEQKTWFEAQHDLIFWDMYTRKVVGVPEMLLATMVRGQQAVSEDHPYMSLFWKMLQSRSQDHPDQPSFTPSLMFITQWAEDQHPQNKVFVDRLYFMANTNTWPWKKAPEPTSVQKRRL